MAAKSKKSKKLKTKKMGYVKTTTTKVYRANASVVDH